MNTHMYTQWCVKYFLNKCRHKAASLTPTKAPGPETCAGWSAPRAHGLRPSRSLFVFGTVSVTQEWGEEGENEAGMREEGRGDRRWKEKGGD